MAGPSQQLPLRLLLPALLSCFASFGLQCFPAGWGIWGMSPVCLGVAGFNRGIRGESKKCGEMEGLKSQSESSLLTKKAPGHAGEGTKLPNLNSPPASVSAHPTGVPRSSQSAQGAVISPSLPALRAGLCPPGWSPAWGEGVIRQGGDVWVQPLWVLPHLLPVRRGTDELLSKSSPCAPAGHSTFITITMRPNPVFSPA